MKNVVLLFTCFLLFFSIPKAQAQTRNTLDVPYKSQNTKVWCWAASMAMVFSYYKYNVEDCQILTDYFGYYCCSFPSQCYRGGMPNEIPYILNNYGISTYSKTRNLSFNEIIEEIDNSNPIIAWVNNSAFSAHVVVVSGYDTDTYEIRILDPYFGRYWIDYDTFVANWQTGVWTISYLTSQ